MLTSAQVATVAYAAEDYTLLCPRCFDNGDTYARAVSQYEASEEQAARGFDGEVREGHDPEGCYCEDALECEGCGATILEGYEATECEAYATREDEDEDEDEDDIVQAARAVEGGVSPDGGTIANPWGVGA